MAMEFLWFYLGCLACLAAGAGIWIVRLIAKTRCQKEQIGDLLRDKGALTMRVSILEDSVKAK